MLVTPEFDRCCRDFENYPSSLIQHNLDIYNAKLCRQNISDSTSWLLKTEDAHTEVWFRDIHTHDGVAEKQLRSDLEIAQWLGDSTQNFGLGALPRGQVATYRDPKCRFIYFTGTSSRSALNITRRSFTRILTFHQVMPSYFELVSNLFGYSEGIKNPTYFAFRDRVFLHGAEPGHNMPGLGRSGKHLQLAYIMKRVASSSGPSQALKDQEWSIRSAAFYHHFDIDTGAAFWLTTHGRPDLRNRIKETTDPNVMPNGALLQDDFRRTLRVHLLYVSWASEGWRHYIQWFDATVSSETRLAVYGSPRDLHDESLYNTKWLGRIQILEEKIDETIIVLEGNISIIKALRLFYANLVQDPEFPTHLANWNEQMLFDKELERVQNDLESVLAKARHQSKLTGDRKKLVLLQLQDRNLAKSETITLDTRKTSIKSQHEAVIMRIFTAVTLVYLPATFVSTVFSTDIIDYQNATNFSLEAFLRWLQVSLPLTFVTLAIAGAFYYKSYKSAQRSIKIIPISNTFRSSQAEHFSPRLLEKV